MRQTRAELLADVERLRRRLKWAQGRLRRHRVRIADDAETVALAEWVLVSTGHPIPWAVNAARRATPAKW